MQELKRKSSRNKSVPGESAELTGVHLRAFLNSLAEEEASLPAQFLKFLLFGGAKRDIKDLHFLKWEGVDFESKRLEITPCLSLGIQGTTSLIMTEAEELLLCEIRANRDKKSPWVFQGSKGRSVVEEAGTVLRRVCRKANLKGVNFDVLDRSQVPISEIGIPTFPYNTKFYHLPQHIRNKALAIARARKPEFYWYENNERCFRGREAAIKWLEGAFLIDIADVVDEEISTPTYWFLDSDRLGDENTLLNVNFCSLMVQELLGLEEYPKATLENIYFEAGFHLFLVSLDDALSDFIFRT